jgi:YesN/AraC family two-component response regulator
VLDVSNGKLALELLREKAQEIDLLLTDLIMPEMNGMELVEKVEKLYPGMEVLYASGYTDDQLADAGALDESIHFIHKPYSVEALANKVRCVLDS